MMRPMLVSLVLLTPALPSLAAREERTPNLTVRVVSTEVVPPSTAAKNAEIEAALDREYAVVRFLNRPFRNAIEDLFRQMEINAVVLWTHIEDAGVEQNTPTTLDLKQVPGRTALTALLKTVGGETKLAFDIREGLLVVDTVERLDSDLIQRIYDVRDLVAAGLCGRRAASTGDAAQDAAQSAIAEEILMAGLTDVLQQTVAPDTWTVNGGRGQVMPYAGLLIVSQAPSVHRRAEATLNALLRSVVGDMAAPSTPETTPR